MPLHPHGARCRVHLIVQEDPCVCPSSVQLGSVATGPHVIRWGEATMTDEETEATEVHTLHMSPEEVTDQAAVIERAHTLQERILARRGGGLLPPAWRDIWQAREERTVQQQ
jgi:hypothetical protein